MSSTSSSSSSSPPTDDGQHDDNEVEHVPAAPEVVPAHAEDLHDRLQREDGGEDDVDDVQRLRVDERLVVVLHRHRDHVQQDQHHDGELEAAAHRDVEEEPLHRILRATEKRRMQNRLLQSKKKRGKKKKKKKKKKKCCIRPMASNKHFTMQAMQKTIAQETLSKTGLHRYRRSHFGNYNVECKEEEEVIITQHYNSEDSKNSATKKR